MAATTKSVVYLKKPIRINSADYSVIVCRPFPDTESLMAGTGKFYNLGLSGDLGLVTHIDNIQSIIYENVSGAITTAYIDPTLIQGCIDIS